MRAATVVHGQGSAGGSSATLPPLPPLPPVAAAPPATGAQGADAPQVVVIRDGAPVLAGGQGTGTDVTTGVPPDLPVDPEAIVRAALNGAIPIFGILLGMVACLTIGLPLARAFARRLDRRTTEGMIKAADVLPTIRQLQESVDAMAIEVERISEAQRFQARLMSEHQAMLPPREGPPS